MIPTIFDCCTPREDILKASLSDYAADLRSVIAGRGPDDDYRDPKRFFANTYPTDGLRRLLEAAGRRLSGAGGDEGSTIRLDSTFGGGKTHGMIALVHVARTPAEVPPEFLDPALRPRGEVAVAAFDGEMANVVSGVQLEPGLRAKTPWGYLAYRLGGVAAFESLRANDEQCSAPGSEDWLSIIGQRPALILIDEVGEWLRKLRNREDWKQLAPFLKGLMAAVDARPNACLILSLAIGRSGRAIDAFAQENEYVAAALQEAEAVSARKVVVLNPTREDETANVLARRLFDRIDRERAAEVVDAYAHIWEAQRAHLPEGAFGVQRREALTKSYPFHPDLVETLNAKTATFQNFQRVRGMLRILAPTVRALWERKPADAATVHVHHVDLGMQAIRTEFTTRLGQQTFDSAISYDIANADPLQPARAQRIDDQYFKGMAPVASYVARTIFVNSMAFNDELRGLSVEQLRASMLSPGFGGAPTEGGATFIEDARKRFCDESGYLDDRTTTVLRFAAEANLTRVIEQTKANVDRSKIRETLKKEIAALFRAGGSSAPAFDFVPFPGAPSDVADDANEGKPYLAVVGYEAESVDGEVTTVPPLVARIAQYKGSDGTQLRLNRNNVVFLLADRRKAPEMEDAIARRLALEDLDGRGGGSLAEHQIRRLRELRQDAVQRAAIAIQQCYRHVFFPSSSALDGSGLAHLALEVDNASANPGDGQRAVIRALRDHGKVSAPDDLPINATPVRDRTPLGKKGHLTTADLREEFRRDRTLPILLGDEPFRRLVRGGVDNDVFVYVKGEVVYAKGTPPVAIEIGENAFLYTKRAADEAGVWPRHGEESVETVPASGPRPSTAPQASAPPTPPKERPSLWEPAPGAGLHIEAPLREAFSRLQDDAAAKGIRSLRSVTIVAKAMTDANGLVRYAPSIRDAKAELEAKIAYEVADGSECLVEFTGSPGEARHVFEFAAQQVRLASDHTVDLSLRLSFDRGLALGGEAYRALADALAAVSPGPVILEAQA